MKNTQVDQFVTKVYKKRWFVLILLILLNFLLLFTYINFTVVNNIIVAYFNTSYAAVDWSVLGYNLGSVLIAPLVAWLALKETISCKNAMITSCVLLSLNFIFNIVGFFRSNLFAFVVIGQVIGGISSSFLFTVPTSLAQIWFPESQIGLATGIAMAGGSTGGISGFIIPSQILMDPQNHNESWTNWNNNNSTDWFQHDKSVYQWMFLTMLVIVALVLILLLTFVPQLPEKPPSVAQHLKRKQWNITASEDALILPFVTEIKNVMFDKVFLTGALTGSVTFYIVELYDLSTEAIIRSMNHGNNSPEKLSGYLMSLLTAGVWFGNIISGLLLDKFKKYYLQLIISAATTLVVCVGILLSVYLKSLTTLFVLSFAYGLSSRICYISDIDSMMQHTYPTNPLIVTSLFVFLQNIIAILFIEIGRQIIYHAGLLFGLLFICALMLLVTILCVVFKARTKRLEAENSQSNIASDETFLLSKMEANDE